MPENTHIAQMAAEIANEIFPLFYWQRVGPSDIDWECVKPSEHNKRTTHPSDAVWRYINPYTTKPTYIIFDYKSLANNSITPSKMGEAARNLAQTLDCAMVSKGWMDLYLQDDGGIDLQACLFVYNHDTDYKRLLSKQIFANIKKKWPKLKKQHDIVLFDPHTLVDWYSISYDLLKLEKQKVIPTEEKRGFYQPDQQLQNLKRASDIYHKNPLLLDQIPSQFIVIRYEIPEERGGEGFILYYRSSGSTIDEFIYLIEYLFFYQLIDHAKDIHIRLLAPDNTAPAKLEQAKAQYADATTPSKSVAEFVLDRLKKVTYGSVTKVTPKFLETELGMKQ